MMDDSYVDGSLLAVVVGVVGGVTQPYVLPEPCTPEDCTPPPPPTTLTDDDASHGML